MESIRENLTVEELIHSVESKLSNKSTKSLGRENISALIWRQFFKGEKVEEDDEVEMVCEVEQGEEGRNVGENEEKSGENVLGRKRRREGRGSLEGEEEGKRKENEVENERKNEGEKVSDIKKEDKSLGNNEKESEGSDFSYSDDINDECF